jgi:hypothetical protein
MASVGIGLGPQPQPVMVWPEAVLLASNDAQLVELAYGMVLEGVDGPLRDLWWELLEERAERKETREWLKEMKGWKGQ